VCLARRRLRGCLAAWYLLDCLRGGVVPLGESFDSALAAAVALGAGEPYLILYVRDGPDDDGMIADNVGAETELVYYSSDEEEEVDRFVSSDSASNEASATTIKRQRRDHAVDPIVAAPARAVDVPRDDATIGVPRDDAAINVPLVVPTEPAAVRRSSRPGRGTGKRAVDEGTPNEPTNVRRSARARKHVEK